MPVARPELSDSRVIAHVDMDCFYVQVEQRKQPTLRGQPAAVVQYNSWKGGGLIAVGYEARKFGVKRSMRGDEAKKVCPNIQLVQVPVARGKADLTVYRDAGSEVVSVLSRKGRCERASIDEVYLDLTEAAETMLAETSHESMEAISEEAYKSHILGLHLDGAENRDRVREWFLTSNADRRDKLLACGALIVAELRLEVLKETEFTCSAGIAHNKMLAKLASGMNKPAQQTVVPFSSVKELLESLPIKKMKQLGGKLGTSLQADGVNTVGDLLQFSELKLQDRYGVNTGTWLWNIARGICGDEVEGRLLPKSHGSGKTFPGRQALKKISSVQKWLNELCEELNERLLRDLERNKRIARTLTLHASAYKLDDSESLKKFPSKSCPLRYGTAKIQEDALNLFNAGLREYVGVYQATMKESNEWAITGLSVSASKIDVIPSGTHSIMKYFHHQNQTCTTSNELNDVCTQDAASLSSSGTKSSVGLNLADPEIDTFEDEAKFGHVAPGSGPDGDEIEVCKDGVYTSEAADKKDPPFSRKEQSLGLEEDTLPSCLDTEIGLELKHTQSKMDFLGPRTKSDEKKRKLEKGTSSILRFFQSQDSCSLTDHADVKTFQESGASSSGNSHSYTTSISYSQAATDSLHELLKGTTLQENSTQRRSNSRTDTWSYRSDEIDPSVLNELPPEIQAEVRAWTRPQKRADTVKKKGSSIAHYFSPSPNS